MRATGVFDEADPDATAAEVATLLATWSVRGGSPRAWARSAADRGATAPAEWVVEYDADLGLVSFELWSQERRVYGIDDWLG